MSLPTDDYFWSSRLPVFDFTLKFEQITLEIVPSSVFLLSAVATYLYYRRQLVYARNGVLLWLKLVSVIFFNPPKTNKN